MSKLNLITLALLGSAVLASSGCGSNSSGADGTVNEAAFDGQPGQFAGTYTGTCTVQVGGRVFESCQSRVRIWQSRSKLRILAQFFVNQQSNRSNVSKFKFVRDDSFTIAGKGLLTSQVQVGVIGQDGLKYVGDGQVYKFVRNFANSSIFEGVFTDRSGQTAVVNAVTHRGAPTGSLDHRSRN